MKQFIDHVEIDSIQEIIGDEVILKNWVLSNEVLSLREILQEMTKTSTVAAEYDKSHDEISCQVHKVPSLQEWNRELIISQVVNLLQILGDDGTKVLDMLPIGLANYFHDAKERNTSKKSKDYNEHSSCKLESSDSMHPPVRDYFDEMYIIRQKLSVFDMSDVLPTVLNAFANEEISLKVQAERLRKLIDAKARNKDDIEETCADDDEPSLDSIMKLHSSLEKIREEKDLINQCKKKRNIPPLNSGREDACARAAFLCTKTDKACAQTCCNNSTRGVLHPIDSDCNKPSESQCQKQTYPKSKKRTMILRALKDANELQASNIFSDLSSLC